MAIPIVGAGIGLQTQPRDYSDLYARQLALEQAKAERQRQQKLLDDRRKDEQFKHYRDAMQIKDPSKLHRLVRNEAIDTSAMYAQDLVNLKNSGDPNWENKAIEIAEKWSKTMTPLIARSESYKNLETFSANASTRGLYLDNKTKEFVQSMNMAQSEKDLRKRFGDDEFLTGFQTYADGRFVTQPVRRIDFQKEIAPEVRAKTTELGRVETNMGPEYGKLTRILTGLPRTKAEADAVYKKLATDFGVQNPIITSAEDIAEAALSEPGAYDQYVDRYASVFTKQKADFDPTVDHGMVISHFIDNQITPIAKVGVKDVYMKPRSVTNINTGAPGGDPIDPGFNLSGEKTLTIPGSGAGASAIPERSVKMYSSLSFQTSKNFNLTLTDNVRSFKGNGKVEVGSGAVTVPFTPAEVVITRYSLDAKGNRVIDDNGKNFALFVVGRTSFQRTGDTTSFAGNVYDRDAYYPVEFGNLSTLASSLGQFGSSKQAAVAQNHINRMANAVKLMNEGKLKETELNNYISTGKL